LPPGYVPLRVPKALHDEEVAETRSIYGGIPLGAPEREAFRRLLLDHGLERIERALRRGKHEAAFLALTDCISLYDASELRSAIREPKLREAARKVARVFARRGSEREVLTALYAVLALSGEDQRVVQEIEAIHAWLDEATKADPPGTRWQRLIEAYEEVVRVWPAPQAVARLERLYLERQLAVTRAVRGGFGVPPAGGIREMLEAHASFMRTGYNLARLFLRVDEPRRAFEALKMLEGKPGEDKALLSLLARATAKDATGQDLIAVARHMWRTAASRGENAPEGERKADLQAALRVCQDTIVRFPSEFMGYLCAGEMAYHTGERGLAIRVFESAHALDPSRREPYEALAILYYQRFRSRLSEEALDDAVREVETLERLHEQAKQRWPSAPLVPPLAASYLELGRGFYGHGKVERAMELYQASVRNQPLPETYEQMGIAHAKLGDTERAIDAYGEAIRTFTGRGPKKNVWEAHILRLIGEAHELAGRKSQAQQVWRRALDLIGEVVASQTLTEERDIAEVLLERGRLLILSGHPEEGLSFIERAIETDPRRGESYVDALAFLVPRGYFDNAAAIYRRALSRSDEELGEYFKAYAGMWMADLARVQRRPPDELVTQYLESLDGKRWYVELARFVLGHVPYAKILPKADTAGKKCELLFYESMQALARGERGTAESLWREVLATRMLGYFEYDMAAYYLRHGPPLAPEPQPRVVKPRPQESAPPPRKRVPKGSL